MQLGTFGDHQGIELHVCNRRIPAPRDPAQITGSGVKHKTMTIGLGYISPLAVPGPQRVGFECLPLLPGDDPFGHKRASVSTDTNQAIRCCIQDHAIQCHH
ncbi:hypothetical protein D3C80_1809120 [compost metagenome]